jgi:hypothetical protein
MVLNVRMTRRVALRSMAAGAAVLSAAAIAPFTLNRASAQQTQDASFSNELLPTLGLPELNLEQTADGVVGAQESIEAGRYLVNYTGKDVVGYLLFAQHPADLTPEQVLEQGRLAGSMDTQQPGWVYGGGAYVDPGKTVQVVVELQAGDWTIINSAMPIDGNWETDEKYAATPLTVTEASVASPVPSFDANVHVDIPGMAYVLKEETVPVGPQIWEFKNTGDQSHHMVMMRTPKLVTSDDMSMLFDAFASGTPPAGDNWYMNSTWVGYTALVSPGYTVWNEFDLDAGNYLMICYIADIESGMPHMMMGMWTPFTVA